MATTVKSTNIPTPHYAVIFTSKRRARPEDGYAEMGAKMDELARTQPGYIGIDFAEGTTENDSEKVMSSITVSYWTDEESIRAWKRNVDHLLAQKQGKTEWYLSYEVRVAKVERAYAFTSGDEA
ncbi:hypothetical protein C8F01DRAFT_1180432 [Mycena amicta]|nr:hypothetical protein C8F01DRAFT_1180432 [Mycena amicta]